MRARRSGHAAGCASAAAAAALLAACSPHGGASPAATASAGARPSTPAYHFHGHGTAAQPVKVQDTRRGSPVYVLKATDVYYSTASNRGRFSNNTILFYKGSAIRLTVAAPTADVDRISYDFVLHDGVTAKSATGVTLRCDTMSYNGNTQLLTAVGHVRAVDAQGDMLTGDKAVADLDLQQIHMTGDVGIGRQH